MIPCHHPCLSIHLWEIWLILEFFKAFHSSRSDNELKFEGESVLIGFAPLDQGFLSIFGQLAACKVSDLLHGMTDLMCRAESLVCRKQIAGLLSALGNHTTSTQQMGGDIYKCERRALLHVSSRLPQVTTKPLFGRRINFQFWHIHYYLEFMKYLHCCQRTVDEDARIFMTRY